MNKVTLIGRLTKDPELKFVQGTGTAVATATIAVDNHFKKDAAGNKTADFIPIVVWGKQAENLANYMTKGKLIGVAGRMQTRNYDHKDGYKVYVTEVVAEEVQYLEKGNGASSGQVNTGDPNNNFDYGSDMTPIDDGDIPFN